MVIEQLELHGFMRYRKRCKLDLTGKRTIGIVGRNQVGKSCLLRAVCYALYGDIAATDGRVREVQLINDDSKRLIVRLAVRMPGGELIEIERGRSSSNEPLLTVAGIRGKSSAVAKQLQHKLRVDYEDFKSLSYFVQGDIHQFMRGDKRSYFDRWTSALALWADWSQKARGEAKVWARAADRLERDLEAKRDLAARIDDAKARLRAAEAAAKSATTKAEAAAKQIERLTRKLGRAESAMQGAEQAADLTSDLGMLKQRESQVSRAIRQHNASKKRVASGQCPLLGIHCDPLARSGTIEQQKIDVKIDQLEEEAEAIEQRTSEKSRLLSELQQKTARKEKPVRELQRALATAKTTQRQHGEKLRAATSEVGAYESTLQRAEEAKEEISEIENELEDARREVRLWQFLAFMCGSSGIPAVLIEQELRQLEARCNWVLGQLDYSKRLRIRGHKELAGYEPVCPACGGERWRNEQCSGCGLQRPRRRKAEPTVTVLDGTVERPFALESGGGKTLQSFAVRLAGGMFVSAMLGVPMQLVMLDEVFAHLDASNRRKLMSLVVDKLHSAFGLSQQLVVSHHADVVSVVDDLIEVRDEAGSAVAEWA